MATDKFTYNIYEVEEDIGDNYPVIVAMWIGDVIDKSTGQRVHQTRYHHSEDDAINAALDWMDDNVDNEDIG
jgi:hypothetical protein